ncbi:hypothetical protein ACE6H2_012981 [Prunus campanulata]
MVSQSQSKESGLKKNESSKRELSVVNPQTKSSKKMKFVSSSETEPGSTATISEEPKSGRGMSTMPRIVQRKIQKIKPVVEYNEEGKPYGRAHNEMQSYIGILIDLPYGKKQEKTNMVTSRIQRLQRKQN